jgi:hypothetical protein
MHIKQLSDKKPREQPKVPEPSRDLDHPFFSPAFSSGSPSFRENSVHSPMSSVHSVDLANEEDAPTQKLKKRKRKNKLGQWKRKKLNSGGTLVIESVEEQKREEP